MFHVIPQNDLIDHDLAGTNCRCKPDVDWGFGPGENGEKIIVHHSADRREKDKRNKAEPGMQWVSIWIEDDSGLQSSDLADILRP